MKPRSTVTALLAITESLLAAKAARSARAKQASCSRTRTEGREAPDRSRPLVLRIKTQAVS